MENLGIPTKYGLMTAAGLVAYFLLISLIGLHTNPLFSFLNAVIMAFGLWMAIKARRSQEAGLFKYQQGFSTGLTTGFIATTIFTIFFGIYASEINSNFLDQLLTVWRSDYETGLGIVLFTVFAMGAASTFALTLAYMQLFKKSWNTQEAEKHTL